MRRLGGCEAGLRRACWLPAAAIPAAVALAAIVLTAMVMTGCSHYGFSASVKTHIASVAIPVMENETVEFAVGQDLTDALIEVFSDDNSLRVVGEDEADSILRGTVVRYSRPVLSYDAGGSPREYKVNVVARLSYEDLTNGTVVWESEITGWAVYSVSGEDGELATEEEAQERALEKLAQDVLSRTVQGW